MVQMLCHSNRWIGVAIFIPKFNVLGNGFPMSRDFEKVCRKFENEKQPFIDRTTPKVAKIFRQIFYKKKTI